MHISIPTGLKKLYHKSMLPNSEGFRFLAYDKDYQKYRCEIVKDADGSHHVEGLAWSDISGIAYAGKRNNLTPSERKFFGEVKYLFEE